VRYLDKIHVIRRVLSRTKVTGTMVIVRNQADLAAANLIEAGIADMPEHGGDGSLGVPAFNVSLVALVAAGLVAAAALGTYARPGARRRLDTNSVLWQE
jgi:hypothetical protein